MPYQQYKETIQWLASVLSKDIDMDELKSMVIVEVIADAFEVPIDTVSKEVLWAVQGA